MSQKTLKLKRVLSYVLYSQLKNKPPKDYLTLGEIKTTLSDVLPGLKKHLDQYFVLLAEAEELAVQVQTKQMSEEESKKPVEELNVKWKAYNKEHGQDIVEIILDDESLKTLRNQFEREGWGKNWFVNIEEFGEVLAAFEEAVK